MSIHTHICTHIDIYMYFYINKLLYTRPSVFSNFEKSELFIIKKCVFFSSFLQFPGVDYSFSTVSWLF